MFNSVALDMFSTGLLETLYMTLVSTLLAYGIGLPLGLALVVTSESLSKTAHITNSILGIVVNLLRSVPFLILLIAVTPFTRIVVGTTIGSTATIVPLVIASAPFIARLVESSVKEVDRGVIEAAQCMGASTMQIIRKVMLPEAKPSLVIGAAIAVTTILSYSAMAGIVGGGGLGTIAINYGLYRYKYDIMLVTIAILVIVVQIFQEVGMKLAKIGDRRINQ